MMPAGGGTMRLPLLLTSLCLLPARAGYIEKSVVLNSMVNCADQPDLLSRYENLVITQKTKGVFVMNGQQVVLEPLDNLTLVLDVRKCRSRSSLTSCERPVRWELGLMCPRLVEKGMPYSAFFEQMSPVLKCPIQPGTYNILDGPVSKDVNAFMPVSNGFFRARLQAFMGDRLAICVDDEVTVSPKRSRTFP